MENTRIFIFLIPLFIFLPLISTTKNFNNDYELFKIDKIGLYFNNIGNVRLSNTQFVLLTHLNLTNFSQNYESISNLFIKSQTLCTHQKTSATHNHVVYYCQNSFNLLTIRLNKLKSKFETIYQITGHEQESNKRSKRGIFNGASYIFHWLFGIPDSDDAKFYEDSINNLIKNNRKTQLLMKQQIGIVSNTISNFNFTLQNLKTNEDKLNLNIDMFNNYTKQTTTAINEIYIQQLLSEQLILLSQMFADLDEQLDLLISSITLAKHNIIHPNIISPQNLLKELSHIELHFSQSLPFSLTNDNIHKYFEFSKVNVYYSNNIIIFAIKFPLVESKNFNIYEIIPIPIPYKNSSNTFSYIKPNSPFLLMSHTKVYYSQVQNLERCTQISIMEYICHDITLTRNIEHPTCETTILTSIIKSIPPSCETRIIQTDLEIWHPLGNNKWIFILTQPILLTMSCGATPIEDIHLEKTGILQLKENCKCYSNTYILESTKNIQTNFSQEIPIYNMLHDDCCYITNDNPKITPIKLKPIKITNLKIEDLQHAKHTLNQLDESINEELNKSEPKENSYWLSVLTSTIFSLIAIILVYNLLRWCGIIKLLRQFICCTKEPRRTSDNLCLKIFNTNINTPPVTRIQLSNIIEEDEARKQENIIIDDNNDKKPTTLFHPRTSKSKTRDNTPVRERCSTSREPSVNMD